MTEDEKRHPRRNDEAIHKQRAFYFGILRLNKKYEVPLWLKK
jgi:hypothetical protein